jgi:hypothetical protein
MKVSEAQKHKISEWVASGVSISQIQQSLAEEFDLKLTYMDTRFLIDDLDLELAEQRPVQPTVEVVPEPAFGESGSVSVDLDRITQPGAVASGSVVFSDGRKSAWALDQQGRLMLDAASEGYRPSKEDLEIFQQELGRVLEQGGF